MAYKLSVKAEEDIIHVYVAGARNFGALQAEKYYTGLETAFQFLADTPKAARQRLEIDPPVRVYPYGVHVVIYLIEDCGDVFILRVRHGREDWRSNPL